MKKYWLYILLLFSTPLFGKDWWPLPMDERDIDQDTLTYQVALSTTLGSGTYNAFWMHSNQWGCQSLSPYNGILHIGIAKHASRPCRWYDYGFAIDVYGMAHSSLKSNPIFHERNSFPVYYGNNVSIVTRNCYAYVRLYIIDIAGGIMSLSDDMNTPLGTGSLLFSHNAPSMPALRIGFDRWTPIPGSYGYAAIKGGLVFAWLNDDVYIKRCKLHYKHIGLQLGGNLPINISYELHHAVQWGGYLPTGEDLGNHGKDFLHAFLARSGGNSYNETFNALGNHLGSQQLALRAKGKQWNTTLYWQNIIEDNFAFLGKGNNLPDGRWGITCTQSLWPYINRLTIEYIGTTDQSGPWHDQDGIIYAGRDNYYCNGIYQQGWSYYHHSLGTPLITSPIYNTDGYTQTKNNRVKAWHIGLGGDLYGFQYSFLGTYIQNYGRYDDKMYWYTMQNYNIALALDVQKTIEKAWGLQFGLRIAADIGTQWGNQVSAMLTVSKQGILTTYK